VYLLVGDRTKAVIADFDTDDHLPALEFLRAAAHYGVPAYLERSKSNNYHAWVYGRLPSVSAKKARAVVKLILTDIGLPATEVFPKQDRLEGNARFGNFLNAPMFGAILPLGRTVFIDPDGGLQPFPDQWEFLRNVERVPESLLDEILEVNGPAIGAQECPPRPGPYASVPPRFFGLVPCAQRMLSEGVDGNQRVACFHLALQLKKSGLPFDLAVVCLEAWALKNRPSDGKGVITRAEIVSQTRFAYSRNYSGCGCEQPAVMPYCDLNCPINRSHRAGPQTPIQKPPPAGPNHGSPMHKGEHK
jgi:hypothetical protein